MKELTLLQAARKALAKAEEWIHDQLDGTSDLDEELATLDGVRVAIAKESAKLKTAKGRKGKEVVQ